MRKIYLILYIALVSAGLVGCADENSFGDNFQPSLSAHYLYVLNNNLSFEADRNLQQEFKVESENTSWEFSGQADWISLSQNSGSSNANIHVTALKNTSGDNGRSCVFSFDSTDPAYSYNKAITITQESAKPYIRLSENKLTFSASSSLTEIQIESNTNWSISNSNDWVNVIISEDKSSIEVSVKENLLSESRTASVILNGATTEIIEILQLAPGIPTSDVTRMDFNQEGGSRNIQLTSEVSWSVSTTHSWIEISPNSGNSGTSNISIMVAPNSTTNDRTGLVDIKIGERVLKTIEIHQQGYYLNIDKEIEITSLSNSFNLHLNTNVDWAILSSPEWLTVSPYAGDGNITELTVTPTENLTMEERVGSISIGNKELGLTETCKVVQKGKYFNDLIASIQFDAAASNQDIEIPTDANWTATKTVDWITLSPNSGKGGNMNISVTENKSDIERNGVVSVTVNNITKSVLVNQRGKYLIVNPTETSMISSKGGTHQVYISSNDAWNVLCDLSWVSLSEKQGTGDIDVTLTISDNPSVEERKGEIIFNTQYTQPVKFVVKQAGRYLSVNTNSIYFYGKGGNSDNVIIETDGNVEINCSESWFAASRNGNSFFIFASPNSSNVSRKGYVTLKLTDTTDSEPYQITIPVYQYAEGGNFTREDFEEDNDWSPNK